MSLQNETGTVMIVDDMPANLRLLEKMLKDRGYRVRPFPRGTIALKSAIHDPPDVILLDINMPEMDGYEVCRGLKSEETTRDIPVIFISAHTETQDKVEAFRSGGVDYVTKPFQAEEVCARVQTHMRLSHYRDVLKNKNTELETALEKLKSAQVQLVQSEKMASLGVLTAGVAHEINNPINFIVSGISGLSGLMTDIWRILDACGELTPENAAVKLSEIEILKKETDMDDIRCGVSELMENIRIGAERTAEIVQGLRTFSRLDESMKKAVDVHENLNAALMLLHHRYKDRISIKKEYGTVPLLLCYPGRLNQVFMNILSNALDAIEERLKKEQAEARISIRTELREKNGAPWLAIRIADTGCGIPEEILPRICEPFFTTKEIGRGVGLGLSIIHGIVRDHGGFMETESKQGQGAAFTICLPLSESH
ncbi:MAG: response regulator [Desulfobacterales bacterium]